MPAPLLPGFVAASSPQIAVGKTVHFYPGTPPEGVVATISAVYDNDHILVTYNNDLYAATRGGSDGALRGTRGSFDPLDHRHRRQVRLHITPHAQDFIANLEADPALVTLWRDTYKADIHLILQDPGTQQALFTSTVDRYVALGFGVNYGFLTVAGAHSNTTDGVQVPGSEYGSNPVKYQYGVQYVNALGVTVYAKGMTSVWTNPKFWVPFAAHIETYEALAAGKCDIWIHCQMEPAFISHPFAADLAAAGYTQDDVKEGMQPYLDALGATGKYVVVRPVSTEVDLALPLVVAAGAPGSVWCHEGTNTGAKRRRQDEVAYSRVLGDTQAVLATIAQYMPPDSRGAPLKLEQFARMGGAQELESPFAEGGTYGFHEFVDLNESAGRVPEIGKDNWRQYLTKTAALAGGTKTPTANNVLGHWTVADDGAISVGLTRCVGTGRGTTQRAAIEPWRRVTNGVNAITSDAVDNIRQVGLSGFTTPALVTNELYCWRIGAAAPDDIHSGPTPGTAHESVTLMYEVKLPAVAPARGVTWGLAGNAQGNAHAWNLVWDGTSGEIKLNVRSASGQDTLTYHATPVAGATYRLVVAYDRNRDASATGKWWTYAAGWQATSVTKNSTNATITLLGTHDLLNRTTVLWGIPGAELPYDSDVGFWPRADWTTAELACLNTVTFTLTPTVTSSTVYSGTVDGVAWTFTSDASATLSEVLAGIAAAIDAQTTATVTNTGTTVTVVRDGLLHVARNDYRFLTCVRTVNRWPFGYGFD